MRHIETPKKTLFVLGNSRATDANGADHGVAEVCSTMHWGPDAGQNKYYLTHGCQ